MQKDTKLPTLGEPKVDENTKTATSVDVSLTAGDETSGVGEYEYYVNGKFYAVKNTGMCKIENLTPNTEYEIHLKVYDRAGNSIESMKLPVKTLGDLFAPRVTITGGTKTGEWYTGDVKVTIEDSASEQSTRATKIRYILNGTEHIENGRRCEFTINADGTYTLVAYTRDKFNEDSPASQTYTIKLDKQAPTKPTITLTGSKKIQSSEWYTGTITATITAGTDSGSGVTNIRYTVTGGNSLSGTPTVTAGSTVTVNLPNDGTSVITAWTRDAVRK